MGLFSFSQYGFLNELQQIATLTPTVGANSGG